MDSIFANSKNSKKSDLHIAQSYKQNKFEEKL